MHHLEQQLSNTIHLNLQTPHSELLAQIVHHDWNEGLSAACLHGFPDSTPSLVPGHFGSNQQETGQRAI